MESIDKDSGYWETLGKAVAFAQKWRLIHLRGTTVFEQPFDAPPAIVNLSHHSEVRKSARRKRHLIGFVGVWIPGPAMSRALNLFDHIPALLSSPHKVLSPIKIEKGTRKRDYDAAIGWLCDAMLFNICRCSSDPSMAIGLSEDVARVKCYLLDTGLLISLAFMKDRKALNEAYGLMLDGKLSVNRGMFFENAVSQELVSQGCDLWFTEFEKEGSGRKYEVDFILPDGSGIVPLEVKSSRSTIHSSLDKLMGKYRDRIGKAYVVHSKDLRVDGDLVYLPIYMLPFIRG